MFKGLKILAIIPARAGSKGIPGKNIINIDGKPLIQYTIDEAKKSKYLDEIVVSTDSEIIGKIAEKLGVKFPFKRPKKLAEDSSRTIDTILYTIDKLEEQGFIYDYIVTLQPTQPLRKSFHIDEAIEKIINENGNSLISVSEVNDHPILMKTIDENGKLKNILNLSSDVRRQDFPKTYKVDGIIYINKINDKLNKNTSLNDNEIPYIIEKQYNLDIDEPDDLIILKAMLKKVQ